MEEALEYSFRALTAILYGYENEIAQQTGIMQAIITKIFNIFDLNVHKCEDLSTENAAECLQRIIDVDQTNRTFIMTNCFKTDPSFADHEFQFLEGLLNVAGYIKDKGVSYAKLFLLKALTALLSTANFAD